MRRNHLIAAAVRVAIEAGKVAPAIARGDEQQTVPQPENPEQKFTVEYVPPGHPMEPGPGEQFRTVGNVAFVRDADRPKIEAMQRRKQARRNYGSKY